MTASIHRILFDNNIGHAFCEIENTRYEFAKVSDNEYLWLQDGRCPEAFIVEPENL